MGMTVQNLCMGKSQVMRPDAISAVALNRAPADMSISLVGRVSVVEHYLQFQSFLFLFFLLRILKRNCKKKNHLN